MSLKIDPVSWLGWVNKFLWNMAARLITLHESKVFDQSELLRLSTAYLSCCSGFRSGFSSVS